MVAAESEQPQHLHTPMFSVPHFERMILAFYYFKVCLRCVLTSLSQPSCSLRHCYSYLGNACWPLCAWLQHGVDMACRQF